MSWLVASPATGSPASPSAEANTDAETPAGSSTDPNPAVDCGPEELLAVSLPVGAVAESGVAATPTCSSLADDATTLAIIDPAASAPADDAPSPTTTGGGATELEEGELTDDDGLNDNEEARGTGADLSPRRTRANTRKQNAR